MTSRKTLGQRSACAAARFLGGSGFTFLSLGSLFFFVGCGGSGFVPVQGTATHKGQPLENLFIKLEGPEGATSWGSTDSTGHFKLVSTDRREGAATGNYLVWVEYRPLEPMPGQDPAEALPAWREPVEEKYGRGNSELRIDITGSTTDLKLQLD